ncbi:MAG: DUF4294 domain-containing protein [Bacteroidaceae bacterium]|nr:DUF4294 domain-containing protein [Bacteroidaceae bacterium]
MKNILCFIVFAMLLLAPLNSVAQGHDSDSLSYSYGRAYIVGQSVHRGETIPHIKLPTYYAYAPIKFKNKRQRKEYDRLVRDVKRVLPLATEIRGIIIETYEALQLLPDDKAREKHIDKLEKELKDIYTPKMKKLTLRQGKLLIKLVDRECNQNAYQLIKLFMGSFKAVFYNAFASMFGASLKKSYDPTGKDWMVEQVVVKVVTGQL